MKDRPPLHFAVVAVRSSHADFLVGFVDLLLLLVILGPVVDHLLEHAEGRCEVGVERLDAEARLRRLAVFADERDAVLHLRVLARTREREHDAAGHDVATKRCLAERASHATSLALVDDGAEPPLVDLEIEAVDHLLHDRVLGSEVGVHVLLEPGALLAEQKFRQVSAECVAGESASYPTELDFGQTRNLLFPLHLVVVRLAECLDLEVLAGPQDLDGAREVLGEKVEDAQSIVLRNAGVLEVVDEHLDQREQSTRPTLTLADPLETGKQFGLGHHRSSPLAWVDKKSNKQVYYKIVRLSTPPVPYY
ncbi:MAG: hypothetical protein G01um101413_821 [Parcubacteria group bacterium Gr01-1014_13]|nr:MAG: hypothetical protein G01um101413_821 [Parcubacteria group bacterium Gr01-1014_13]